MNMNVELVHSISDDFPGCEISQFGTYSTGFLRAYYTADGKEYQKYYPVDEGHTVITSGQTVAELERIE